MAAYGNTGIDKGFKAAAAVTKHRFVKLSANETVTPVTAVTDQPIGVTMWSVSAGEITKQKGVNVRVIGLSEVECSAAVTIGAEVSCGTDGRARVAVATERVVGIAMSTTAVAAERLTVLLTPGGHLKP